MSKFRVFALLALAAVLAAVIVLTWGSIGSVSLTFCLLLMGASLLYQRYLTNNDSNDYDMEQ